MHRDGVDFVVSPKSLEPLIWPLFSLSSNFFSSSGSKLEFGVAVVAELVDGFDCW